MKSEVNTSLVNLKNAGTHRFHLRKIQKNHSVLNIDARFVLYLNPIATEYLQLYIQGVEPENIVKYFTRRYSVSLNEARDDFQQLLNQITLLLTEKNVCPIHNLGFSIKEPFINSLEFPLRADFAITYRCNNNCPHCYVERDKKSFPELSTKESKEVIQKLYKIGIPHIAFTGGEASLREDLSELIRFAQDLGLVTGVITNGRKFADINLVREVVNNGLDYVQITLESHDEAIHDAMQDHIGAWRETTQAIRNFISENVYCMTNSTLCTKNKDSILETVQFLDELGVNTFAMNGLIYSGKGVEFEDGLTEEELKPITASVAQLADELNMRFVWYTPTQYCTFNPIEQGLGPKRCSAAKTSIGVEPNGDVIPCQSYFKSVGNLLTDSWNSIWNSNLFKEIRSLKFIESKCRKCDMLDICGGGCPLFIKQKYLKVSHISHL